MASDQRFSLRWNNYQTHLVTAFESLLEGQEFIDVTLGCEGRKLPAHKMLLSACSPYFRELLKDNLCQHPIIVLRDVTYTDMHSLLQFMYNGEVNVTQDQLNSFLKTAESLKIRGLTDNESESEESAGRKAEQVNNQNTKPDVSVPSKRKRSQLPEQQNMSGIESQLTNAAFITESPNKGNTNGAKTLNLGSIKSNKIDSVKQELIEVGGQIDSVNREDFEGKDQGINDGVDDYDDTGLYDDTEYMNESALFDEELPAPSRSSSGFTPFMMGFEKPKQFPCSRCDKSYAVETSLNEHLKVHTGETTCQICKIPQARIATLRRHLRSIHKLSEQEVALMVRTNK